jgi:5S rRNA maturation endonuclease (ribonuclease M5)
LKKKLNSEAELVFKKLGMECEVFNDNIYSTCPIHDGSDNPRAFSFSPERGIWKCWTRDCQQEHRNDIFGLISGVLSKEAGEELDFKDVLQWVKKEFNIQTTREPAVDIEDEDDYFSYIIKNINTKDKNTTDKEIELEFDEKIPSEYFFDRGYKKSTLKHFNVGDCSERGIMKDRAIIPIYNDDGSKVVAAIGRSTKEYRNPKFLFYPTGFNKRFYFYNYHNAIEKARETSCLYILEGQGDVWRMFEAGVSNAVSIFGKNISNEQMQKLVKLPVTRLIILTDNDQAGRESKVEIQRKLSRMYKLTFPTLSHKDVGEMSPREIKIKLLKELEGTY